MELAVILVLAVIVELALTFYLLGRIKDYRRTLDGVVNRLANVDYGLGNVIDTIGVTSDKLGEVQDAIKNSSVGDIAAAAQVAQGATPDEVEQAKSILTALGVKLGD